MDADHVVVEPRASSSSDSNESQSARTSTRSSYSRSTATLDVGAEVKKALLAHSLHTVRDLTVAGKHFTPDQLTKGNQD